MPKFLISFILFMTFFTDYNLKANPFEEKIIETRNLLQQGINSWDEAVMQETLARFQRLLETREKEWLIHFYIALSEYRLGIFYMNNDKKQAGKYLNDAIDHLKKVSTLNDTFPETYALLSSCYGNKIGITPWKGMFYGPRSSAAIDQALELGPQNPRVWLQKGIGTNFSPKAFGGGKEKALSELKKAITFYEKEDSLETIYPQWGYDEAYTWLGNVLKDLGKIEEAREVYEKALEINPENGWIKYELLPNLDKD